MKHITTEKNNNLILVTDNEKNEQRYFRTAYAAYMWTGIFPQNLNHMIMQKCTSRKFPHIRATIVDGSEVKWKDIDNIA